MFHLHKWKVAKRGSFEKHYVYDTLFYCKCGKMKKKTFVRNFKDAGYTEEEYLELIKSLQP
jgi:hypothetical protein